MLELGVGAGRVTRHLCAIASEVHGIDVSQAMVEHAQAACPEAIIVRRDLRDLSEYEPASFDALLAPFNVLDVLDHDDRERALEGFGRVVAPDGLLIMSSHNRAHAPFVVGPGRQLIEHLRARRLRSVAAGVVRLPRRMANRRRLGRLERDRPGYAIVNDSAHDYSILHYYISRDDQARQLGERGLRANRVPGPGGETGRERRRSADLLGASLRRARAVRAYGLSRRSGPGRCRCRPSSRSGSRSRASGRGRPAGATGSTRPAPITLPPAVSYFSV